MQYNVNNDTQTHYIIFITLFLFFILSYISIKDLYCKIIPNNINIILLTAGLAVSIFGLSGSLINHIFSAAFAYLIFAGVGWSYFRLRGIDGLGLGDAKLLSAAGAWVGLGGLPSVVLIGSLTTLLLVLIRGLWMNDLHAKTQVPFGPGLSLGFFMTWAFGPIIIIL